MDAALPSLRELLGLRLEDLQALLWDPPEGRVLVSEARKEVLLLAFQASFTSLAFPWLPGPSKAEAYSCSCCNSKSFRPSTCILTVLLECKLMETGGPCLLHRWVLEQFPVLIRPSMLNPVIHVE